MYPRPNVLLGIILGLILAALFIWSVNVLFVLGIPFTLKTYLASLTLLLCLKYFTSKPIYTINPWFDEFYDEEDADDDEDAGNPKRRNKGSDDSRSGSHLRRVK